ncbi:LodA/GoxA family CTQ-dependent oxidase [Bradyrhizobium jicamae]|uniref:LodA/GoxA family CTQ-dependent oxidase n=1 Tax=Bradyrhizobium jicamae TaxID=280332 RepID=UPI001BA7528A|nr:LodA/GoxA family CTQ-dependent oxidase [Bradyrhizobium jicamae]MBR0939480.1 LodA/GoxA family CTQ-dependent oxidase [Bradyrhizobium jicamae]
MGKIYKIHPGIGVARVAPSTNGYFLAGETPGADPFEIDSNGNETPFTSYKDANSFLRRQGARFRVFEYDQPTVGGSLTLVREITAADAKITWSVHLVAAKAAGPKMNDQAHGPDGRPTVLPLATPRNVPPAGFGVSDLKADVRLSVTGANATPVIGTGRIVGADVMIGEARTDANGRLVVLAGRGVARSWANPPPPLDGNGSRDDEFLNNPTWHDDIADGTVDAKIAFTGGTPIDAVGAWVITTPPDFAPDTDALTTMLDIVENAIGVPLPVVLTYPQDIEPMLKRAAGLFFVNEQPVWATMADHMANPANLNSPSPAAKAARRQARDDLLSAQSDMRFYGLTKRQTDILARWVDGSFQTTADATRPAPNAADTLDRSVLARCVGGGFFPGIEAGTTLRQPTIYAEFARLTRGTFTDVDNAVRQLEPGLISHEWRARGTRTSSNASAHGGQHSGPILPAELERMRVLDGIAAS